MLQHDNTDSVGQIEELGGAGLVALKTWLTDALLGTEIYWSTLPALAYTRPW